MCVGVLHSLSEGYVETVTGAGVFIFSTGLFETCFFAFLLSYPSPFTYLLRTSGVFLSMGFSRQEYWSWAVISLNTFCINKNPSVVFNVPRLTEKAYSAEVEHKALLQPVLGE